MGRFLRPGRVIPAERVPLAAEAEAIREQARQHGRALIERAEAESSLVIEQARQHGLDQGRAESVSLLVQARAERRRALHTLKEDVISLSIEVARKIIGREVRLSHEVVVNICATALDLLPDALPVVIKVHPEDEAMVRERLERLAIHAPFGSTLTVEADGSMGRGGCLLETELGRIDARIETQLAALEAAMTEEEDV